MLEERHLVLIKNLQEWADLVGQLDTKLQKQIQDILHYIQQDEITLTFGGHFKSGKSTVLNGMLSQALLPTDEYPETGAICCLTFGEKNAIQVYQQGNSWRNINFSTEAIRQEISLISQTGERRLQVNNITLLYITLRDSIIPTKVRWMDSPGINDTSEMNDCAWRAALQADVLLWVLSSRQCLSEPEVAFLANYIQERGPASVVFVVNIFLQQDTQQEWQKFLSKQLPVLQNKVYFFASQFGFTNTWQPLIIPISGRAVGNLKTEHFGGGYLRAFLLTVDSPEQPRVQFTRLFCAVRNLMQVVEQTQEKLQQEQARVSAKKQLFQEKCREAELREQKKRNFLGEVESAIDNCLTDLQQKVNDCGVEIAKSIDTDGLRRGDDYTKKLNESVKNTAREMVNMLISKIEQLQNAYQQLPLSAQAKDSLRSKLTPANVTVEIANNLSGGQLAGAATTGAIIGNLIFPGFGGVLGAVIGSGFSLQADASKDVVQTKSNVIETTKRAGKSLKGKQQEIVNFIESHCCNQSNSSENLIPTEPDTQTLEFWENMYQKILKLSSEGSSITAEI